MSTSANVTNRSPASAINGNILEVLWLGKNSGYMHLRRPGCVVYFHADQGKLKARAEMGIIVSYPSGVKGCKVWLHEEKKCVIRRNVVFTKDKVYKDLNVCEVKANYTEELRNQIVQEDPAGSTSGP